MVTIPDMGFMLRFLMNLTMVVTVALVGALVIWGVAELAMLFWPRPKRPGGGQGSH